MVKGLYSIAIFDFDGTITKKDTFLDFILYSLDFKQLILGTLKSLPILILYIFRVISTDRAKEKIFSAFFKNLTEKKFNQFCENYSLKRLPQILRPEAVKKIKWHKEQGHRFVIVSASIDNWIRPWAVKNGFDEVIATIPEAQNGLMTGKFQTKNCNREEKRKRFLEKYSNRSDYYLFVYGNDKDDNWLFEIADEKFYRRF
jgi:HAD superfamily hydrolase (TIGR01490 family)